MRKIKSHFWYTKSQRNGILLLLFLIVLFEVFSIFLKESIKQEVEYSEREIRIQAKIDSLKNESKKTPKIFPFNPNYITDYKGYTLGMSLDEIDRLHKYRENRKFVNSAEEFQNVTKISDSLLNAISPYFKFPDWVVKRNQNKTSNKKKIQKKNTLNKLEISTTDLNKATASDFLSIVGIGEELANRIIAYREKLKGFYFSDQLNEIYGINNQQVSDLLKVFSIQQKPRIQKINVNTATFKEVLALPYIDYELCVKIFDYRDEVAELQSISELRNIEGFPKHLYNRIVVYLQAK